MLLTIGTDHQPATDLGFLLHKHPDRCQSFDLSFGKAYVFYPVVSENRCEACLLLDVDPVELVRGRSAGRSGLHDQYVNDLPYVGSSLMSVAISKVFRSALNGQSRERPELANLSIPLTARIDVLPIRGGEDWLTRIFEPLGYEVVVKRYLLDRKFEEWGNSPYFSVELKNTISLANLLQHLYVLIPVFDQRKHYFIGQDEVEKLIAKGETWLSDHPERASIARRYLKKRQGLVRQALARLVDDVEPAEENEDEKEETQANTTEGEVREQSLHEQRLGAVMSVLRSTGVQRVIDLGCGEGKLLKQLLDDQQFNEILGMDISIRSLEIAHRRLKLDRLPDLQRSRIKLIHGALTYRDNRLAGFDAATIVEVIEHLDPARLAAFERVVFEHAQPKLVVLTTPNVEYNVMWDSLPAGAVRHADHRFEWTRSEFRSWSNTICERFDYSVDFLPIGPEDKKFGAPSQMSVFKKTLN